VTILVSIQQDVAAWQIPAAQVARLREALPDHEVIHATTPSGRAEALARCEVAFTWILSDDELKAAPNLRWVHSSAVAVGTLCLDALDARGIVVSNTRGVQAVPIAEHVFACLLALTRRMPLAIERQRQRTWAQNEFSGDATPELLRGRCLGVVGLGSIGGEVARLGGAFGMEVVAVRRDPARPRPAEVSRVWGPDGLDEMLGLADAVVIAAPLTGETTALFDAARLARMKRGARLVNVARGQLVDGAALAHALTSGALAGAALDVFVHEPLPQDDPLWQAPNLLLTPHTSGFRARHWDDVVDVFLDNLRRWNHGMPVQWTVDLSRGY
jgi:phosphoglycerate dehydrogenase-like enzyme